MTDATRTPRRPAGPARVELDTSHITRIEVPFRFLTYVFGGGVEHLNEQAPGQAEPSRPYDPVTPVRATGIRGQLRFWWRATTGARCANIQELRDREAKLWGGIWDNKPVVGVVGITVDTNGQRPTAVPMFGWGRGNFPNTTREGSELAYGAFPMRPQGNNGLEADPRSSVWDHGSNQYTLALDILDPAFEDEVLLALNAWLTVGGYGGRTTRGFGAVALATDAARDARLSDLPEDLQAALGGLAAPRIHGVPSLVATPSNWAFCSGSHPRSAWGRCLSKFQEFRQLPGWGRNEGQQANRPGRSRWPEPDALRRVTRRSAPEHRDPLSQVDAFPRGDFGMPIVFHFKDRGEPEDLNLQPADKGRFPSPLILRPTAQGKGMAVRLVGNDAPEQLQLVERNRPRHDVRKSPTRRELQGLGPHQRRLLVPEGAQDADPITAFMQFFSR